MMFSLDEDIYDENEIEELELNCPWTITVLSGPSHEFMIKNSDSHLNTHFD